MIIFKFFRLGALVIITKINRYEKGSSSPLTLRMREGRQTSSGSGMFTACRKVTSVEGLYAAVARSEQLRSCEKTAVEQRRRADVGVGPVYRFYRPYSMIS